MPRWFLAFKTTGRNVRTNGLIRTEKEYPKKIWGVTAIHESSAGTRTGFQLGSGPHCHTEWDTIATARLDKGLRQKPEAKAETNV